MKTELDAIQSEKLQFWGNRFPNKDEVVERLNEIVSNGGIFIQFGRLDVDNIRTFQSKYDKQKFLDKLKFEGGLCMDYILDNTKRRFIMGYTELGDWIEYDVELKVFIDDEI